MSPDPEEFPRLVRHLSFIVDRLFIPASILLFIAGLVMTIQRWEFQQTWIAIAIVLWLASILAGSLYLGPMARRGTELFDVVGPTSAAGQAVLSTMFRITRIELGVFAFIIALMVAKPNIT